MKSVVWSAGLIAALLAGPVAAAQATPVPVSAAKPAKVTVEKRIEQRLKRDKELRRYDIDVAVKDGVATLTGTVAQETQRERAGRLANVRGVTRVDNQIAVNASEATGTAGTLKEKTKEGAEKSKSGAEAAGRKVKEGVSKTGEVMTDAWVTTRVKSRFVGEDLLKDSDINVDTNDHVVTLKGTVMSDAGRARAAEIAKTTEGVHRVVNELTVGPKR